MSGVTETASTTTGGWRKLLGPKYLGASTVLAGGVALYATNEFLTVSLMPSAVADIGGHRYYAWVTTVYLVASVAAATTVHAMVMRIGPRLSYLLALSVFGVGSLACALAPSLGFLIAARFVAGATIGAFIPLSLAWIGDSFPYAERQPVLARFLIGQMVGIGFGTALAGGLSEHFGWRAIFVLLAAVLLAIAALLALEARRHPAPALRASITQSLARMPRLLAQPSFRGLVAIGFFEGFFIFGALAFVALHFQRRFGVE